MMDSERKTEGEDLARLLIVDDDEVFCQVLSRALGKRGFEVIAVHNGADALDVLTEFEPGYAIVDLRIGAESGLELVKRIMERNPATRLVMLTGYASIATAVEAIKLGAVHYLTKPASPDEILSALEREEGDSSIPVAERPISVKRLEWEHLQRVLLERGGNISAAARALGMHRRTLQRKLAKRPVKS